MSREGLVTASATQDLAWRTRGQSYKPWHCYWRIQYLVCNSHFHQQHRKTSVLSLCLPTSSPPPFKLAVPRCPCPSCFWNTKAFTATSPILGTSGRWIFLKCQACSVLYCLANFIPWPIHEDMDNIWSLLMAHISASDPPELLHRLAVMCDTSGISQFVDCHRFAFTSLENQSQESKARFSLSSSMPLFSMWRLMTGCNNQ